MSLKQTLNRVTIEGYVNSKDLKFGEKDGKRFIAGQIDIRVEDENIVPVQFFSYEKKKDGQDNTVFKGLQTVCNDTVAISEVDNPTKATKVRITNGSMRIEDYIEKNSGNVASSVKYTTNFITRVNDDSFSPKAKFEVEMLVQNIRPEIKDDEETGEGFVDGFVIDFGGHLKPLTLKVNKKNYSKLEKQWEAQINKNDPIVFWGDIINSVITKTIVEEADLFGEDNERVITSSRRERVVAGAKLSILELPKDEIKKAFKEREEYLEILKDKASGIFDGGSKNNKVEDDELPFLI